MIPTTFLWWVVLALAFWGLLERNRIGNHIFAAGGNRQAAVATGVRVDRTKLLAFGLAGATAALGGILAASYINNIAPSNGEALPLEAIAACVIGDLALTGGARHDPGHCLRLRAHLLDSRRPPAAWSAWLLYRRAHWLTHHQRRGDLRSTAIPSELIR